MKAQNKTVPTKLSPSAFLKTEAFSDQERANAKKLISVFEKVTKKKCVLWGKIFGFGEYHYKYPSGREGDFLATGFALRKNALTIYIVSGLSLHKDLLQQLGPHKISGGSCLYLKTLEEIRLPVLEKLISAGIQELKKRYPEK